MFMFINYILVLFCFLPIPVFPLHTNWEFKVHLVLQMGEKKVSK
jgi:hypothetical protein